MNQCIENAGVLFLSNGCHYYNKEDISVGIISDKFFFDAIKTTANFIYITPKNWKDVLKKDLSVILITTTWNGINGEWRGLNDSTVLGGNKKQEIVIRILHFANKRGIPTVFFSLNNLINFPLSIEFAKRCNHIFTLCRECIPYYVKKCKTARVRKINFFFNPQMHNPIGMLKKSKTDEVLISECLIDDNAQYCKGDSSILYGISLSEYHQVLIKKAEFERLQKKFRWAACFFSQGEDRINLEGREICLQANGVSILSNYNIDVNNEFPNILMIHDAYEVPLILNNISQDVLYEHQLAGIRSVMSGYTCYEKMDFILHSCGITKRRFIHAVLVISHELTDNTVQSFEKQSYQYKELILDTHVTPKILDCYSMVTWFDTESEYGVFYLEDMVNGFKYTTCDYITKDAWYKDGRLQEGIEHDYVNSMKCKYRTIFWTNSFSYDFFMELNMKNEPICMKISNGYSIDHAAYNKKTIYKKIVSPKYLLSVIVPIYKNGRALYGKCFSSLRRSSIFKDMEIILVDDGSNDQETFLIEEDLKDRFSNVVLYRFRDSGSGSASRPRNKGVDLATSEYIAFLDPDNEAICDGYAKMLKLATSDNRDIVAGNMYTCIVKGKLINYYKKICAKTGTDCFNYGSSNLLVKTNFFVPSIQTMVIRKKIITMFHLSEVIGAAGQDTLFSWQLLQVARRIRFVDYPIHVYYARTYNSINNVVNSKYFKKLLLLQPSKFIWLREQGLLRFFMMKKFDAYTVGMFQRLKYTEDLEESVRLVYKYLQVYREYYHNTNDVINTFIELYETGDYKKLISLIKNFLS